MGLNHYIADDASYVEYPYVKFVADSHRGTVDKIDVRHTSSNMLAQSSS